MSKKKKTIEKILKESIISDEEQPYEVPENWVWMRFDSVIKTNSNRATAIKQANYEEEGEIPVIDQGMRLISGFTNNQEHKYTGELPVIVFGDHTRCIKWIDFNFAQGADGTKLLKPLEHLYPKYFYYLLKTINLPNKGYSRHFKYLRDSVLPVPPLEEQKRIVGKVENFLKKIDEAKLLIEKTEESSKLRRSAIFNRAFSGDLTSEWRSEIYGEDSRETNKINSSDLPLNWRIVELREILQMQNGLSKRKGENGKSIPVLRLSDIKGTKFNDSNLREIKLSEEEYRKYCLDLDDILFIRVNGSFDLVGKAIHFNLSHDAAFSDHLIRATFDKKLISASYLKYLFESSLVRDQLKGMIVSSAGQNTISQLSLGKIKIPLPPKKEMEQITNLLGKIFVKEENILSHLKDNISQLHQMKQSVLLKAFKGELGTNILAEDNAIEFLTSSFQQQMN
ncbi:restriction endonuclease subunit S [Exiguobacterium sp. s39]|uniref:restriction endonuclease subunit S n=1 Tax=Exiguobacterium sp. s39 TaxID=2751198 RepID=UPI001BE68CC8